MTSTAIVHEWITSRAGSERVFEQLAAAFPDADLYCLSRDRRVHLKGLEGRHIATTTLDLPVLRSRPSATLVAMPIAWKALNRNAYDRIISSSHAFSRHFRSRKDGVHFSYVHSPMRYAWFPEIDDRLSRLGPAARPAASVLRNLDRLSAARVQSWAANSTAVSRRIWDCYRVHSKVIYPPVDTERFDGHWTKADYVVAVSRFVPYKRLDLAIKAADMAGVPLALVGYGPCELELRAIAAAAAVPVEFITGPTDTELAEIVGRAQALVFPALEDFGIVAVEAQAAGTPVVAVQGYGADDSVIDGVTGVLVAKQAPSDLAAGLQRIFNGSYSPADCRLNASRFGIKSFQKAIRDWVDA